MLQQTQIKTALPYFDRWMKRFPNFTALANAESEIVLKHWEGLGYYNRARNLHKVAQWMRDSEVVPDSVKAWKDLPGIGDYTAAAIASIAQGVPAAVVDGNVVRVLARLTNEKMVFPNNGKAVDFFKVLANKFHCLFLVLILFCFSFLLFIDGPLVHIDICRIDVAVWCSTVITHFC